MPKTEKRYRTLLFLGIVLFTLGFISLALIFYPIIKSEITFYFSKFKKYQEEVPILENSLSNQSDEQKYIVVKDRDFGLVIPKLNINVSIIPDVDPNNPKEYQRALTKGVAHAKNTSKPDTEGNIFLFAHSSDSFLNANLYNAIFYLLHKLEQGDFFYIVYNGKIYKYEVIEKTIASPEEISYYYNPSPSHRNTVTLMTCWPPATTIKRLLVIGTLFKDEAKQDLK